MATSHTFRANSRGALDNAQLQRALGNMHRDFVDSRGRAVGEMPEYDALKADARAMKDHVLANLDFYLERFASACEQSGGHVHWAQDAADARRIILDICKSKGARTVTKSKSMIGEEIAINPYLEQGGLVPIETDLGEYIIQLADEPPSHITAPAIHKSKEDVAELFLEHHGVYGKTRRLTEIGEMCDEAREVMRSKFIAADVGLTGANFIVAETGATAIATNEGNGDLTQILPKTHIVLASIDKVVPTAEDGLTLLRLLARTASGLELTTYNTFSTGPRRDGDADGPEEFHVVLLDNGRSEMMAGPLREMLRCIRCGACLNHCPVYKATGGHAYGWVYPGPMGAVLTPALIGLEKSAPLPNASTFCGRCEAVCPMGIPLPSLMRHWREREFSEHRQSMNARNGLRAWSWLARRPKMYRWAVRFGGRVLRHRAGRAGRLNRIPLASGWTAARDMPSPEGPTFMDQWKKGTRA
ncbi:MAG: iron-sulfur cluster-binding protein [Alphaproteobacteria bacterium]|jgi:L-lactate dehydrogenase complex protein LldF|nr:iron-sulfur cluster-binding protein [Alphaproteobacteria bacterium]